VEHRLLQSVLHQGLNLMDTIESSNLNPNHQCLETV